MAKYYIPLVYSPTIAGKGLQKAKAYKSFPYAVSCHWGGIMIGEPSCIPNEMLSAPILGGRMVQLPNGLCTVRPPDCSSTHSRVHWGLLAARCVITFVCFYHQTTTGKALKDFKRTKSREDVKEALQTYLTENPSVKVSM